MDRIRDDIEREGYSITRGVFSKAVLDNLCEKCDDRLNERHFKSAGIGAGTDYQIQTAIRGDEIWWLNNEDLTKSNNVFEQLDRMKVLFNRTLYLGLSDFEGHLARYKPGLGYQRHYDRPVGSNRRKLTVTIYLNKNWLADDGGQLRLYLSSDFQNFVDIEPSFGTAVLFLSEKFPHEVLPSKKIRLSFTGWFLERF